MSERLWNANYLRAWSANFMLNFSFMLLMPVLPLYLKEAFGADKGTIGMVLSCYALTALLTRPFSGYLVDRFPRKQVLLLSNLIFAFFFGGYIVAGSLLFFFALRTLHGAPMGLVTVANSTMSIDVLPSSRRAEGIGYFGLANNLSTAVSPLLGLMVYEFTGNFQLLFTMALVAACTAMLINSGIKQPVREQQINKQPISLDRFFLLKGWPLFICMTCFAMSFGVLSTYLAIYGKEQLGMTSGSGWFFTLLSTGLIASRLMGARQLRMGRMVESATQGVITSAFGYALFALVQHPIAYYASALIIGLGNGHMFPAFQNMFINLGRHNQRGTANSTLLTAWDLGIGLGIIIGGFCIEHVSYQAAFLTGASVNVMGTLYFLSHARQHFQKWKLR